MNTLTFALFVGAMLCSLGDRQLLPVVPVSVSAKAPGSLDVDGERIRLASVPEFTTRLFVPVVPGSLNALSIADEPIRRILHAPDGFSLSIESGGVVVSAGSSDSWGYASVETDRRKLTLTLVALTPATEIRNGLLDGYRIGSYRAEPLKGLATYAPPLGFIRLSGESADVRVSDSYTLRDFQCKLDGGGTKFLVLRPEALIKLELMQHKLARRIGNAFGRFTIMSGFRTPYYNSRIGNETSYSRHLYGDAMDIYVDRDGDGQMDDINHDGRVNQTDASLLLAVAEEIDQSAEWGWLKGGAGVYRANKAHGPFVHVDTRGYVARWGILR
jgi:hypothetical protein